MKSLLVISLIFVSFLGHAKEAKKNLKNFNKALIENISDVIEDNPHVYEKKPIGRTPASISGPIHEKNSTEKLDEVEEQVDTHTSW